MKPVFEKKKNHSGEQLNLDEFMITKKINVWLRDKIWYYCYYIRKGQKWRDEIHDLYKDNTNKPLGDIEGMKTAQLRAKDIKEGVITNIAV